MTLSYIVGGYTDALNYSATEYCCMQGGYTWNGTESNVRQAIACAGTLKKLYFAVSGSIGAGSFTFTLYKNNVATSMAVTITYPATSGSYTGDVSVSANDYFTIESTDSGASAGPSAYWYFVFDSTTAGYTPLMMGCNGSTTPTTGTVYNEIIGANISWSDQYSRKFIFPCSGTLRNLYINLGSTVDPAGITLTFTIRYSTDPATTGSSTGITCAIAAGASSGSDLSNTFAVTAGDMILLECAVSGGTASAEVYRGGCVFIPSVKGQFVLGHVSGASIGGTGVNASFNGYSPWTVGTNYYDASGEMMIRKMYLHRYGAPGGTTSFKCELEDDDVVVSAVVCTLTGSAQVTNSTDLTSVIAANSTLTWLCTNVVSTPTYARGSESVVVSLGTIHKINGVNPFNISKVSGVSKVYINKMNAI